MKYKAKYLIDHNKGELKGYEVSKIIHNVERETNRINPVCVITAILVASFIVYLFIR